MHFVTSFTSFSNVYGVICRFRISLHNYVSEVPTPSRSEVYLRPLNFEDSKFPGKDFPMLLGVDVEKAG